MATFPALAEPVVVPAAKLTAATLAAAGLEDEEYAVLEPTAEGGTRVRRATVDEELAYEREHGLLLGPHSTAEFLAELDRDA